MADRVLWRLEWPGMVVYSSNEEMRDRWTVRHRKMKPYRVAGWAEANKVQVPDLGVVEVEFITIRPDPMDADGPHPTYKALLDGVVSAGVLVDDGPKWVRSVTYHAVAPGPNEVRMMIREIAKR